MGERERLDDRLPDRREGRHIFFVPLLLASLIFACAVGLSRVVCPPPNRRWRLAEGSPGTTRTQQSLKIVSPVNRDHVPSLTSTADCAGDVSRPVLAGADVVEYFNIPAGSEPVIGKGSISTLHNGYLFFFNSTENRGLFEVSEGDHLQPPIRLARLFEVGNRSAMKAICKCYSRKASDMEDVWIFRCSSFRQNQVTNPYSATLGTLSVRALMLTL